MLNVGQVLKTVSATQTDEISATSTFLNWLSFGCESDDMITPELITCFFQDALEYPHWRQASKELGDRIRHLLESICLQLDETIDFGEVIWPSQMQVIEINLLTNWVDIVNGYLTTQHVGGDRFRIVHDEVSQKLIGIVLKSNGAITVREFSRLFFIRNGALTPLREDLQVHYDSNLELMAGVSQKMSTGTFMTTQFFVEQQQYFGNTVRGLAFQMLQSFEHGEISNLPKLFYSLRRMEQHFLKKEANPYYQKTMQLLEHGIQMVRLGDEDFIRKAPEVMAQAQNALDYVFIGDKLLGLLLRDLLHSMAAKPQTAVRQVKEENTWSQKTLQTGRTPVKNRPPSSDLTN